MGVTLVGEFTVNDVTVIPAPKLAVVVPWTKCVFCPVIATDRFCWPCRPVAGIIDVKMGVAGDGTTEKLFGSETLSVGVRAVTVRGPGEAEASILSCAVATVGAVTTIGPG